MADPTLLERYAARLGVSPKEARKRLFSAVTPWWRRPFMPLFALTLPGVFRTDWSVIDDVGGCRTIAEAEHAVEIHRYRSRSDRSWIRTRLGFRVSGRRLLDFAAGEFNSLAPADPTQT